MPTPQCRQDSLGLLRRLVPVLMPLAWQVPQVSLAMDQESAQARAQTWLAQRLRVDPRRLTVSELEPQTWNDSSLGCPKAGESYTQALVPGYRVAFSVGVSRYEVHVGPEHIVSCDPAAKHGKERDTTDTIIMMRIANGARDSLARELHARREAVAVNSIARAAPGERNAPCPAADYIVTLSYRGRQHVLVAESQSLKYCRR